MNDQTFWIRDKWDERRGRSLTVKILETLESYQTKYQKIAIYQTECFGKMMQLDDVIMFTEFDEFAYHEMISHVALHVHPNPQNVLIIGGGDGGAAREVLKHNINRVDLCDIDEEVTKLSRKYFPTIASKLDDPRLHLHHEDGAQFIRERKGEYDVIIVDSTDPWGPAEVLFKEAFYRDMYAALTEDGIVITQSESMYYDQPRIKELFDFNQKIFKIVKYFYTLVPTYPSGQIGFSFCSKKYDPLADSKDVTIDDLKYYTKAIHQAAFVLPNFMKKIVN